jgi:uncharacterized DUF497 family protein
VSPSLTCRRLIQFRANTKPNPQKALFFQQIERGSCPVATVEHGDFEWDDSKATSNEKKHGVTFVEAATVFDDADFLLNADPGDPSRFIAVGFSAVARVLVVVHATRAERIRLVSARRATLREERLYVQRRER